MMIKHKTLHTWNKYIEIIYFNDTYPGCGNNKIFYLSRDK